jgi:hypothetical protein
MEINPKFEAKNLPQKFSDNFCIIADQISSKN